MAFGNKLSCMARQQRHSIASAFIISMLTWGCAHSLSGNLKDVDGKAVSALDGRVNVIRLDGDGRTYTMAEVDKSGSFQLEDDIDKGSYLVEALVPGYQVTSIKIDITPPARVEFVLKKNAKISPVTLGTRLDIDDSVGAGGASLAPPKL